MVFGIDYAWGRPRIPDLLAAGVTFVVRYVSNDTTGKNLVREEAEALSRAGINLVLVWESTARRPLDGADAGRADAFEAYKQSQVLGMPEGRPIYFAVDWDASADQQGLIDQYLRGADSVLRERGLEAGIYGGYWQVKRALDNGSVVRAWQTYAWSGGKWDPRVQLQQYDNDRTLGGAQVDFDRSVADDFGQWRLGAEPDPPTQEVPVAGTAAQAIAIAKSYLGVVEKPMGSNKTIIGEKFGWNGVAWCSEYVSVCWHESGLTKNQHFPWSASTGAQQEWFRDHGRWHSTPKPGDAIFYSHQGRDGYPYHVELVAKVEATRVLTYGGNTSGSAGNIEGNGDGCYLKWVPRSKSTISGYGRPFYQPEPTKEDDVPEYISLRQDKRTEKPPAGGIVFVNFDAEGSDPRNLHGDGAAYPTILPVAAHYEATIGLSISNLPAKGSGWVRLVEVVKQKDGSFRRVATHPTQTFNGKDLESGLPGDVYVTHHSGAYLAKDRRLRVEVGGLTHEGVVVHHATARVHFWPAN